jgi:hypothetical protein
MESMRILDELRLVLTSLSLWSTHLNRWGVTDENTKDHMTWLVCERGLRQCYDESMGCFFFSLQSEK